MNQTSLKINVKNVSGYLVTTNNTQPPEVITRQIDPSQFATISFVNNAISAIAASTSAAAYTNAINYVISQSYSNSLQLSTSLFNYQTTVGLASNVAVLSSNNSTYLGGVTLSTIQSQITSNSATAYANAVSYTASQFFVNTATLTTTLTLYAPLINPLFTNNIYVGNTTVNTTINSTSFSGTSNNSLYLGGTTLSTIQTQIIANSATTYTNAISFATSQFFVNTSQLTSNLTNYALLINPLFTNNVYVGNSTVNTIINSTSFSGTSNNALYLGGSSLATIQTQITSNSATAYTNAINYVIAGSFVNTSQLTSNLTNYALLINPLFPNNIYVGNSTVNTTINSTSFSGTSNNALYLGGSSLSTIQSQITSNSTTAYTNAVNYVVSGSFVNSSQLTSNLVNYALLINPLFPSNIYIGNSTVNTSVNSTSFSGTSNNALYLNGTNLSTIQSQITSNSTTAYTNAVNYVIAGSFVNTSQLTSNLINYALLINPLFPSNIYVGNSTVNTTINSTSFSGTSNNSLYLGGVTLATIQTQITSNAATAYTNAVNYVVAGSFVNSSQLTSNLANYALLINPLFSNTVYVGNTTVNTSVNSTSFSGTSNNSTYLNGQLGSYYTTATNITTGTLPYSIFPVNIANTTGSFTITGVHTHNANIVVGSAASIVANGTIGTTGQVLTSNGTTLYYSTMPAVTTILAGNAINVSVVGSNTYISSNSNSSIEFVIDGGGSAITTGIGNFVEIPFAANIVQWTLVSDVSGNITIDVLRNSYSTYGTNTTTVGVGTMPNIASSTKNQAVPLSWTATAISAGDWVGINITAAATVKKVTLSLKIQRI